MNKNQNQMSKLKVKGLGVFSVQISEDYDAVYTEEKIVDFSKEIKISPEKFFVTEFSDLLREYKSVSIEN